MGYFKIKKNFNDSVNNISIKKIVDNTQENEYHLIESEIEEERLSEVNKISFKKKYAKETFEQNILTNKPIEISPNTVLKKGLATTFNNNLNQKKPKNLSSGEKIFDNRFIGVNNERTEKIAVLVHCYFMDVLMHTVLPKLLPLSKYADFYFNFIEKNDIVNQKMAIELIKNNFINYTINYTKKNIGRDINGQFNNLKSIYESDKSYDFYLFVHTKKSTHLNRSAAKNWVDNLLNDTVGNYDVINKILDDFKNNKKLGIVGSKNDLFKTLKVMFSANKEKYYKICEILNVDKTIDSYFIAGTFFWSRAEIIDYYFKDNDNLKIISSNFDESGLLDGDWHHAMERIYGTLCYSLGYTINNKNV